MASKVRMTTADWCGHCQSSKALLREYLHHAEAESDEGRRLMRPIVTRQL